MCTALLSEHIKVLYMTCRTNKEPQGRDLLSIQSAELLDKRKNTVYCCMRFYQMVEEFTHCYDLRLAEFPFMNFAKMLCDLCHGR